MGRPRRSRSQGTRKSSPIVALTTDFGVTDSYVAEMKGVLLSASPADVRLVDVTHGIGPQDVLAGSIVLERALRAFPAGTVHVAVVDPGVGSERRLLLVEIHGQRVVCPDNGLITWPWRRMGHGAGAYVLTWRPAAAPSATFHGRDVMAPAAAMLVSGTPRSELVGGACEPILLAVAPADDRPDEAQVIHVDHFGNATTNVPAEALASPAPKVIRLGRRVIGPLRRTYADVADGRPLALIGSSGLLEVAVRNGSAAHALRLRVGDRLTIEY